MENLRIFKGSKETSIPQCFTKPDSNAGKFQLENDKAIGLRCMWPMAKIRLYTLSKEIIYKATI